MEIFSLDAQLIQRYALFARSFSEIRAPELKAQIDDAYASGRFWPEPLITINPRFERGKSIQELCDAGLLDRDMACPSSNDLRLFVLWKNGVSGSVFGLI
jgi:hypothetical protein